MSAILVLGSTGSVLAKFPYFSVALDPAEPRPDQPVTVTVRTWADPAHSEPTGFAGDVRSGGIRVGLIEFQRVGDGEGPRRLSVPLDMVKVDLFRGEVRLPAGEWRLVAFPLASGPVDDLGPGYPKPIRIVVEDGRLSHFPPPAMGFQPPNNCQGTAEARTTPDRLIRRGRPSHAASADGGPGTNSTRLTSR